MNLYANLCINISKKIYKNIKLEKKNFLEKEKNKIKIYIKL